uniref:Uncharacterized protein n=1 Tax=Arundo donax TaxID=35708 RepID=A0A0A9GXA0_ARUDO
MMDSILRLVDLILTGSSPTKSFRIQIRNYLAFSASSLSVYSCIFLYIPSMQLQMMLVTFFSTTQLCIKSLL